MVYPDNIREQQKEKYCEVHEMWKVKNAIGMFSCPFCAVSDPQNNYEKLQR